MTIDNCCADGQRNQLFKMNCQLSIINYQLSIDMKYYLIVGEASGDLHASHLMAALKVEDPQAEFRFFGGDLMAAVGGTMVKHYKELAYMGFIPVLLHLRTIFANMRRCKEDIVAWQPDVVILVDYPGFNLSIAKFLRAKTHIPVYYYISPKIWAWKEYRIKNIKRDVDELFSILPFEVEFFEDKHHYPIHYVGNPTVDEVTLFRAEHPETFDDFVRENNLNSKPIIALLAGSRKQEIKDNLPDMLRAASAFPEYQLVLAGAPGISPDYYHEYIGDAKVNILFSQTYRLLQQAEAALVTSGTATLEAALFRVPQAVCYHTPIGKVVSFLRRHILTVKYISLVNLIANREVVKELVADTMTVEQARAELERILYDKDYRQRMLDGYEYMAARLGDAGAPKRAAQEMVRLLRK
ncbi:lipid-A-disaccharide synthase [Bacteroides intestinalis]